MHRSDQTHVAFGAALLTIGLGGVIALVLGAPEGDWWWPLLVLLSVLAVLAVVGAYVLAAVYVPGLWLPPTRADRELTPRLRIDDAIVDRVIEGDLAFYIGFRNTGRGRITGALVEVKSQRTSAA